MDPPDHAQIRLSPSVASSAHAVAANLPGPIASAALARYLLTVHGEYGDRGARRAIERLDEHEWGDDVKRQSAREWVDAVRAILDPATVPELHGRLLLIGLARVDRALRDVLSEDGFLAAVESELAEPIDSLIGGGKEEPALVTSVPVHRDDPAVVDELSREWFARALATRIRYIAGDQAPDGDHGHAFLIHLHGRWGSGKTSLLNFLAADLRRRGAERCLVIEFNAWRHQRISPPWWWLMVEVYRQGTRELWGFDRGRAVGVRLREWLWRARGGWPGYLMVLVSAALLIAIWRTGFFDSLAGSGGFNYDTVKGVVVAIAALLTPILTIWGVMRAASRWVLATSARGARAFVQNTRDPMHTVQRHMRDLVRWLHYPIVIVIDDLDRCHSAFVVELLEGIQTLFRHVPAGYVVAADREWLAESFAAEYSPFAAAADEPGRPLGYHFLEKTFQLSAAVPELPVKARTEYWQRLIRASAPEHRKELETEREKANALFTSLTSEESRREEIVQDPGDTPVARQAKLEALAVSLGTAESQRQSEHTLAPFAALVESNPRAMKRLVNAYGVALQVETVSAHNLAGDRREQRKTALWTILNLRWPSLGGYLVRHPGDLERLRTGDFPPHGPMKLKELFGDPEVLRVIDGAAEDIGVQLDVEDIEHRV